MSATLLSSRYADVDGATGDGDRSRAVGWWLLVCAVLVLCMVVIGGVTRLTRSGLSMVEWSPLMGFLPPLSVAEWERVFDLYKQSPEYLQVNLGMSMAEFRSIFLVEYFHRLFGRLIGIAFLVPFVYFVVRGFLRFTATLRLGAIFLLGGLQGVLGWYMVQSGLVDNPSVSHYRLTAHLALAVVIFGLLLWNALDCLDRRAPPAPGRRFGVALLALVFIVILSGGLVAGTRAGFIMNTFPLMGGQWVPDGLLAMTPAWLNFLENAVTIQFAHRVLALSAAVLIALFAARHLRRGAGSMRTRAGLLLLAVAMQVSLGIATLVHKVPVALGAAHQGGALVVVAALIFLLHGTRTDRGAN